MYIQTNLLHIVLNLFFDGTGLRKYISLFLFEIELFSTHFFFYGYFTVILQINIRLI